MVSGGWDVKVWDVDYTSKSEGVGGLYHLSLGMVDTDSLAPGQVRGLLLPPGTPKAKGKASTVVTPSRWKRMKTRYGFSSPTRIQNRRNNLDKKKRKGQTEITRVRDRKE